MCQISAGKLTELSVARPSFPHFRFGGFNKNINPAMVRQCFLAGSSVPPGPCFQALSLSPLKCWSYLFGVSHRAYQSAVSETERLRAPICSPLVSKRLTCPSSRFMSLFRSICPRSAAISVLVRQLGKTTRMHFLQSFFRGGDGCSQGTRDN